MKTKFTNRMSKICLFALIALFISPIHAQQTDAKSNELLNALIEVNGGYKHIASKKDVQFTYIYDNQAKGKDVSTERHIFNGEHSWASYERHERNVLPKQKGVALQSLIHGKPSLTLNGKPITDQKALDATVFMRKVNFYWFTMMYKLNDPGTNYHYLDKPILKMTLAYEKVDGVYLSTVRKSYGPNGKGEYELGGIYTCKDIKFNNGFKVDDFKL